MLRPGFFSEEIIEGDDAVDLGQRNLQQIGHFKGDLAGDIAVGLLNAVENHDQIAGALFQAVMNSLSSGVKVILPSASLTGAAVVLKLFSQRCALPRMAAEPFPKWCVIVPDMPQFSKRKSYDNLWRVKRLKDDICVKTEKIMTRHTKTRDTRWRHVSLYRHASSNV